MLMPNFNCFGAVSILFPEYTLFKLVVVCTLQDPGYEHSGSDEVSASETPISDTDINTSFDSEVHSV